MKALTITIKMLRDLGPIAWARVAVYGLLLVAVYYSALTQLVYRDWDKEDYSHCYLVPLIVLYLVWEKRHELSQIISRFSWSGLVPLGLGIVLFWLGELGGEYFTLYISFWLTVVGLLSLHLGWQKIKSIWFALVMMLTMFPLPQVLNVRLTFGLKLISSWLGVAMLQLYGMSAYREGNVIDLGFTQLQVVDACSGLRYVIPLMVLALLLAYWFKAHLWKRVVIVLSSIPIAVLVNSMRIAVTGILYSAFGAKVAEGFFHGFSGWLIFMFTIPVLLAEMWILRKLPPRERPMEDGRPPSARTMDEAPAAQEAREGKAAMSNESKAMSDRSSQQSAISKDERAAMSNESKAMSGADPTTSNEQQSTSIKPPFMKQLLQPVFVVAIVLLGLTLVISKGVEFREKIPIKKALREMPLQIGEWSGSRQPMGQEFLDVLRFSDYVIVDYKNAQGKSVNFYTAYYESQRKGEAIHSPETCLPGSGWIFSEAGKKDIAVGNRTLPVNRAFMEKSGAKELSYYWFDMRGRALTNLYQVKFYTFWDSLTRQRTDGALVRLITPVYENERLEDAEARLEGFMKLIVPVLKEYIPE